MPPWLRSLLPQPALPPYDIAACEAKTWAEKRKLACQAWALQGYGTPVTLYLFYLVKLIAYIAGWMLCCQLNAPDAANWFSELSFQKAILWSILFEIMGFGCGSGPLTGRYVPPIGGFLYFLRPGTITLPLWPKLPYLGQDKRSFLDVSMYAFLLSSLLFGLLAEELTSMFFGLPISLLLVLGCRDKTLFLAARSEHYLVLLFCFLFTDQWIAAAMAVQVALWGWAAIAKLTRHFPFVLCVMSSNNPLIPFSGLRKKLYRSFPHDLRPSRLAKVLAHGGILIELAIPILLVAGSGGSMTTIGLILMVMFHCYIVSNVPAGVPIEWNALILYSGFFLFAEHPHMEMWHIHSPSLIFMLCGCLVFLPILGNVSPKHLSFLLSMRYYAGNWPYSIWLFGKGSIERCNQNIRTSAVFPKQQLATLYPQPVVTALLHKVIAFRAMHLHGSILPKLLPKAAADLDDYEYVDGELVAGVLLGWNFGDGHLSGPQLLASVQKRCDFQPGQVRCIFVESQPLYKPILGWKIFDAATGELASGHIDLRQQNL